MSKLIIFDGTTYRVKGCGKCDGAFCNFACGQDFEQQALKKLYELENPVTNCPLGHIECQAADGCDGCNFIVCYSTSHGDVWEEVLGESAMQELVSDIMEEHGLDSEDVLVFRRHSDFDNEVAPEILPED